MTLKHKIIIGLLGLISAFAIGRFTAAKPEVTQVKEVVKDKETVKNVKRTTTKTKDKDGNEKTVTVVDSVTDTKQSESSKSETKVTNALQKYRVGVMLGLDKEGNHTKGLMAEGNFIGPVNLGAFVLDNRNYGFTITVGF